MLIIIIFHIQMEILLMATTSVEKTKLGCNALRVAEFIKEGRGIKKYYQLNI